LRPATSRADEPPSVAIAPRPSWVVDAPRVVEEPAPRNGVSAVLFETQTRYERGQRTAFVRGLIRIANALGVQSAGQRRFDFFPPFQKLILHQIEIRRGSARISQLDHGSVRVLEQEPGLAQSVYTGLRTVVVELTDLRVGDQVAYEY